MRMEAECKMAWDYLNVVTKHDSNSANPGQGDLEQTTKARMTDFLNDAAERIIVMNTVHKKVKSKYSEFMSWMGIPVHLQSDYRIHHTCKTLSEFSLEYRTTRERVIQTMQKKKAAREKKRQAKLAAAEAEAMAAAIAALGAKPGADPVLANGKLKKLSRRSREEAEDTQLRALLGNDIDVTDNGTLRRKKKHHHRKHRSERPVPDGAVPEGGELNEVMEAMAAASGSSSGHRSHKERKEKRRHRSSLLEGTLPITEDNLKSFTGTEMERGLLETLMGVPDEISLKRNKERRKSVKERKKREHELKRSRTRENNVLEDQMAALMEEQM